MARRARRYFLLKSEPEVYSIDDLARETGIQLTPGEFFGDGQAFRMGFGIDPQLVRAGLQGIEAWLHQALEEA